MDDIEVGRYALRTFRLTSARKARLISLNSMGSHNPAWTDGTCSAVCLRSSLYHPNSSGVCEPPHESPSISCTCGIYGSLSYRDLLDQYGYNVTRILAIIAAEGTTLIGSRGLRTQYARVVAFNAMDSQYKKTAIRQFDGAREYTDTLAMLDDYGITLRSQESLPMTSWSEGMTT